MTALEQARQHTLGAGRSSVAAGARTDTTWRSREIVGFRNWVLGTEWGILCRTRFRVYRRDDQGRLSLVLATNQDRVESVQLRCHLRAVGSGADLRLRIATGPDGEELFATDSERARTEAERARMAEQEIARLRAELEALRCQLDQLGYAGHFT